MAKSGDESGRWGPGFRWRSIRAMRDNDEDATWIGYEAQSARPESITGGTLDHYNRRAEAFWQGTRDHDVKQNIAALLQRIEVTAFHHTGLWLRARPRPQGVCRARSHRGGSGRRRAFRRDGAPIAAATYGSRISSRSICRTAISMACSPTPRCFMSPAGNCRACCWNCAQVSNRVACCSAQIRAATTRKAGMPDATVYHDLDAWRRYLSAAGFVELDHYYRPAGLPREEQPWLASVWRR